MLRLRFGLDDLARTTFELPSPVDELAGSAQSLQQPGSEVRRRFQIARVPLPAAAWPLLDVVPPHGDLPGFLIPEVSGNLAELPDLVSATPPVSVRSDLQFTRPRRSSAAWHAELAAGRPRAMEQLGEAIVAYRRSVLEPMLPTLRTRVTAELGRLAWQAATQGMEAVLGSLHPAIRWHDGVLEVAFPGDVELELGGRGLVISPSAAWTRPGFTFHWCDRLGLVYPLPVTRGTAAPPSVDRQERLSAILGSTRARVLTTLAAGDEHSHSTSSLAIALGVSQAAASMHASVLRRAGLVATRRAGRAVRHTLTDLGRGLIEADPGSEAVTSHPASPWSRLTDPDT